MDESGGPSAERIEVRYRSYGCGRLESPPVEMMDDVGEVFISVEDDGGPTTNMGIRGVLSAAVSGESSTWASSLVWLRDR